MNIIQVLLLSIIEGITEFLPISSTGHLILASKLLGITQTEFVKTFEVFIQLGAILAVALLYAKTLLVDRATLRSVLVAFVPTMVVGFLLYSPIKTYLLGNPTVVVIALFVGGIGLIALELHNKNHKGEHASLSHLSTKQAFLIGLTQSISVIPGVSRAAATIVGGLLIGLNRKEAVEFSFLLAIPTMIAATGFDLIKSAGSLVPQEYNLLTIGFIGAFVSAFIAVKYFLRFVQTHTFIPFGIYRIVLALIAGAFLLR